MVDLGCLGTALVEMLGGEVDFSVDGFEMDLEVELTLELINAKGFFWGGQGRSENLLIQTVLSQ